MPINGSGVSTKPAGTTFFPTTEIESAPVNSVVDDIYAILNTPIEGNRLSTTLALPSGTTGATATAGTSSTALATTAFVGTAVVRLDAMKAVATRTALKALDTTYNTIAYLKESGRLGVFVWTLGDYAARITADTGEGMFIKATAIASTVGAWVRVTSIVTPQMCGAVVDGATNCYAASFAAFELAKRERLRWHCPAGDYLWNLGGATAAWDPTAIIRGARRAIPMTGDGPGVTNIEITNSASIAWHIYSTTDWFDFYMEGITAFGAFNFPLCVLGQNSFVDPCNMARFKDVSFENSYDGSSNVALRLNYIAGGSADNLRCNSYALAVADVLVDVNGTALECRQAEFVKFSGGAFGNADRSVDFKDGVNFACNFTSSTLENSNYPISNRSASSGAHTFANCQLTNCLVYEVYSSAALADRYVMVENCNFDGTLDVDPSNLVGVRIVDSTVLGSPSAPASSTTQFNTSGRNITVTYWGLSTLTSISINGIADGITVTGGTISVPAGGNYSFNGYTGTLTIRWHNAG